MAFNFESQAFSLPARVCLASRAIRFYHCTSVLRFQIEYDLIRETRHRISWPLFGLFFGIRFRLLLDSSLGSLFRHFSPTLGHHRLRHLDQFSHHYSFPHQHLYSNSWADPSCLRSRPLGSIKLRLWIVYLLDARVSRIGRAF